MLAVPVPTCQCGTQLVESDPFEYERVGRVVFHCPACGAIEARGKTDIKRFVTKAEYEAWKTAEKEG
jgi:hypothetical protein